MRRQPSTGLFLAAVAITGAAYIALLCAVPKVMAKVVRMLQ